MWFLTTTPYFFRFVNIKTKGEYDDEYICQHRKNLSISDTQAFYHGAPGLQVQANTPQIIRLFDGPYIAVSPPTTTIFDQFSDYIRFRPGGVSSMNNIYVTLGKTSWSWSGATSYSSNHWSPATGSVTWPESPDDSNDFPFWSTVFNP